MRNQYRVTKYDPSLRDRSGAFTKEEWTSHSDIGRVFNGVPLSEAEYLAIEAAHLFAIEAFLREAKIEVLLLHGLENNTGRKLPKYIQPQAMLTVTQCVEFARIALREVAWGKLVSPGRAYVHFGYDYYMYFGLPSQCQSSISAVQSKGLFVEPFRSPYLRKRSNPSIEGTSTSKLRLLAAAPHVKR